MTLFVNPVTRATNASGVLSGAKWYFYHTDTLDPAPVYSDPNLETEHAHPVEADSGGLFAPIFLDPSIIYRAVMKTAGGITVQDVDPYNGSSASTGTAFTPEAYGALGDGEDDTPGLLEMVAAVNEAGTGRIVFAPGKTYLIGHDSQLTLRFQGVNGLLIEGYGATLKTKDNGAPTTSLGYNWGQINLDACTNVAILGLTLDGNRALQTHTSGHADGYGYNAGINIWSATVPHASQDILIKDCRFTGHGVLSGTSDARGDCIYAMSGVDRLYIEDCVFENWGRWAFALAEGAEGSEHIYFRNNKALGSARGAGYIPWGAIDIEDTGLSHSHIYIEDNQFEGTTQIALGGFSATVAEVTVSDLYIRRNVWRLPSAGGATDVPFSLGNSAPGTGTYRSLERLFIEHNVVSWAGLPATFQVGDSAKLTDVFIRFNTFRAETLTAASELGLQLANGGHLEGRVEIIGNEFIGLGEGILNNNSWYNDPSPAILHLRVEDNKFRACYRSFNLSFVGAAAPSGSTLTFRNNMSEGSRALLDSGSGESLNGGTRGITLYGRERHEHINAHTNVTCIPTAPLPNCAVAALPAAAAGLKGLRGFVTDANATTFLSTVAGGGSNNVPVVCDGTNWKIG